MTSKGHSAGKVGIVVGGGPAPGINAVIESAVTEADRLGRQIVGINDGFHWLAAGDVSQTRILVPADVNQARYRGGSILHTSRENPTDDPVKMARVVAALDALDVRYLVTIGGDDTARTAAATQREAGDALAVAHVPKTIDNDLPLPGNMTTFGFQTAREVGAAHVRNLMKEAHTTHRWIICVTMGRNAGHLALGIGVRAEANLTIIPEEFSGTTPTLDFLCDIIEAAIIKAKVAGADYGVAVVAEGVAEQMTEELKQHPLTVVEYDQHRHLRLAEVPLALILKRMLGARQTSRNIVDGLVDATVGYELRCADPVPFDLVYCQQLGIAAAQHLLDVQPRTGGGNGVVMTVRDGRACPIPFDQIMDPDTGKTAVRIVDLATDSYRRARAGMTRLEPADLADSETRAALAAVAGLDGDGFRDRFARVTDLPGGRGRSR